MKAKNYNIRKKQILAIMSYAVHQYTAREIADLCIPVSLSNISDYLRKYTQQGLLKRKKENGKFVYWITPRGLERLEYLLGSKSIKPQIALLVREKIKL